MSRPRLLFVDDEPNIRLTLPVILDMHGFEVIAAGTVPEALAAINSQQFDVLIADLNIGQPGDGFTVVSAMRRTQPHAVTIIMTGFPAFETALKAIRSQVDDYIVKPARVEQLLGVIHDRLNRQTTVHQQPFKSVSTVLRENHKRIYDLWCDQCKHDPLLGNFPLPDSERTDYVPGMITALADMLESEQHEMSPGDSAAVEHGRHRHSQHFTVSMLMRETRILRHAVYSVLQENLLAIDVSTVIRDMTDISDKLDQQLSSAVDAYLELENAEKAA